MPRHGRIPALAMSFAMVATLAPALAEPLGGPRGEVRGAVAIGPSPPAPSAAPAARPGPDPRLVYARPTDPDRPRTVVELRPPPVASLSGYVWPLARGRLTLPFKAIPGGSRVKDGKRWHDGIDLATFCGDTVVAAHDGVVLAASRHFDDEIGWVGDLGRYYALLDKRKLWGSLPIVVVIDDGNGYRSMYAHFSRVTVEVGDVVKAGQRIGYEGDTGHASGCHVHYGLYSPFETATFGIYEPYRRRMRLPKYEIARIDPLTVLPGGAEALRTRRVPSRPDAIPAPTFNR